MMRRRWLRTRGNWASLKAFVVLLAVLALPWPEVSAFNIVPGLVLQWPIPGVGRSAVTRDYAEYVYSETLQAMAYHGGLDISAAQGTAVYAAGPGTVVKIQGLGTGTGGDHGFGNTVIVEHSSSVGPRYTQYSHLYEIDAAILSACGQFTATIRRRTCSVPVTTATRLGLAGHSANGILENPGFAAHLHFELKTSKFITSSSSGDDDWYFAYTPGHPDGFGYYDPVIALHGAANLTLPIQVTVATGTTEGLLLRVGPGGDSGSRYREITSLTNGQVFEAVASSGATITPDCSGGWYQLRKTDGSRFVDPGGGWTLNGVYYPGEIHEGWACRNFLASPATALTDGLSLSNGPYSVGQTITGSFRLTNRGTASVTLDDVVVGGRLNDVVVDFPKVHAVTLEPGRSHTYTGIFTFQQAGTYRFFPAFTIGGVWRTGLYHEIPTEAGTSDLKEVVVNSTATRVISLSGSLAFGTQRVGTTATRVLTISNSGNSALTVTGIAYPPGFSGTWSGIVGAGRSQDVTVTFAPTSVQSYGGPVTVLADHTGGANTMTASGAGSTPMPASAPDFNGDGRPDIVWRNMGTGVNRIWLMDNAARQSEVTLPSADDLQWQLVGTGDFTGDGQVDLVWRHATQGANAVWQMNGTSRTATRALPGASEVQWQVAAVGDFDRDGDPDLFWRHARSGQNSVWWMNGETLVGSTPVSSVEDVRWRIVGAGDFSGDGNLDLLWWHSTTGQVVVWYMDGTTPVTGGTRTLPVVSDTRWHVAQVSDFDGDGKPDILWRHAVTGANSIWYLDGVTVTATGWATPETDSCWQVGPPQPATAGDVNADGRAEVVWRHYGTGANRLWYMNGATRLSTRSLPTVTDVNWEQVAVADWDLDGQHDLVWRHATTGANAVWYLRDGVLVGAAGLPAVTDLQWRIVGVGDLNGDARPDLVWRHAGTGANAVWLLSGATLIGTASVTTVSDPLWQIVGVTDFNGDTKPDLLWRHATQGTNVVWFLDGTRPVGSAALETVADTRWRVGMVGDFNGDGHADLFWRHATLGWNELWYLNGTQRIGLAHVTGESDLGWQIVRRQW